MSVACSSSSSPRLLSSCSLPDLNHDHPRSVCPAGPQPRPSTPSVPYPRPVFPAGPQPRPSTPSVPCRTSTTTIHAQCSLPDLNREYPRQVFPAGPHVGRYGTKNVQKKVRKNVRQVCYIFIECQKICQIECQIECQKICQIKCDEICQRECQKICQIKC